MPKCDFNKVSFQIIEVSLWHGCSPANFLDIFKTLFPKNTSKGLLMYDNTVMFTKKS